MKLYHILDWHYTINGRNYFKVGAYGTDDMKYVPQLNGCIHLPERDLYYNSLESAYIEQNELWLQKEKILQ